MQKLRAAMLEIEKITQSSRDLAKVNQELEEARFLAVSDQARTAKRLLLMSSQLEHTEQTLFNLTKEIGDGQKDSDLLRIERIKREALQEREDASRLKLETLQDELHEVQRSERVVQQKLVIMQTKFEALGKRYDLLRRQQQELDLVRESREALAWLKETTERLCSPPQGSLGQAIQQEKSLQQQQDSSATVPINIYQSSPSTSPPYPSAIVEPPLMAQNQLVSLIKELATANSTLRSELSEYRDLLQDARNEVISLRSQVEDYENGHGFDCCDGSGSGGYMDDNADILMAASAKGGLDALASLDMGLQHSKDIHGGLSGSPPPYMITHAGQPTEQHLHHHFHLPGVRGNIFGELERRFNQDQQITSTSKRRGRHASKKEGGHRRSSRDHGGHSRHTHSKHGHSHHHHTHASSAPSDALRPTMTVSTSTSTSEIRRTLAPGSGSSPLAHTATVETSAGAASEGGSSASRPSKRSSKSKKKSLYTDADMDLLGSGSDRDTGGDGDEDDERNNGFEDPAEMLLDTGESGSDNEPGFVATFAEFMDLFL
ncbi:hypothetical protein EDD11_005486 [Mortierella claussenii]|nr:hypothetical protein EDD11_005486 [Mortierella claussenii]